MGGKLPESYPRGEGSPLPALLDEREELSELVHYKPDYTRLRAALRQLDNQLVRNLAHFGFTPGQAPWGQPCICFKVPDLFRRAISP